MTEYKTIPFEEAFRNHLRLFEEADADDVSIVIPAGTFFRDKSKDWDNGTYKKETIIPVEKKDDAHLQSTRLNDDGYTISETYSMNNSSNFTSGRRPDVTHWGVQTERMGHTDYKLLFDVDNVYLKYAVKYAPKDIQEELAKLYQELNGPSSDAEIAEQCRNETSCPISAISLKKLHKLKRLVKLDGRCYSFYAFTQNVPVDKEPFTRAPWSTDAKDKIKSISKYKYALQKEYNELDEDEYEDEENVPASTGGRKKKNRRTKRNKNRSQRNNNKRKTMYRRKNRKH
jgi:hypothetical protein